MNKENLLNYFKQKRDNEKNVQVRNVLIEAYNKVMQLEVIEVEKPIMAQLEKQDLNAQQIVAECIAELKRKKELLKMDDTNFLILNRVIRDIEFTSAKLNS